SLNQFPEALAAYLNARKVCTEKGMPLLAAQADYNIAYLYYLRGEYGRAIEMLRGTRQRCRDVGDHYHYSLCNLDLSELHMDLRLSSEATALAREACEGFRSLGMRYENAKALFFSGVAACQDRRHFEGLKIFADARELFALEKNPVWPSLI